MQNIKHPPPMDISIAYFHNKMTCKLTRHDNHHTATSTSSYFHNQMNQKLTKYNNHHIATPTSSYNQIIVSISKSSNFMQDIEYIVLR